eukprot:1157118-Pelagomonas_calceolata.AAC.16
MKTWGKLVAGTGMSCCSSAVGCRASLRLLLDRANSYAYTATCQYNNYMVDAFVQAGQLQLPAVLELL